MVFLLNLKGVVLACQRQVRARVADAVRGWLDATEKANREAERRHGARLRELVWNPLASHLEAMPVLLISPDGPLTRFPFAALPGGRPDSYLIEERVVVTVPVPRLLNELAGTAPKGERPPGLLLVSGVDFDAPAGGEAGEGGGGAAAARLTLRGKFRPLPGSEEEGKTVRGLFEEAHPGGKVMVLSGPAATEEAFRERVSGSRHVHLATHGFFSSLPSIAPLRQRLGVNSALAEMNWEPGIYSGVAFAGVNRPVRLGHDDGVINALEVATLDLSAADIVFLSGCETGLGGPLQGEGLLGLQRAFQAAGARTVVASLWPVDDRLTRELVTRFYANLWRKKMPPALALRDAQLYVLRGEGGEGAARAGPRHWAGWVLSGHPGDLSAVVLEVPAAPAAPGRGWLWIAGGAAVGFLVLAGLVWVARRRKGV